MIVGTGWAAVIQAHSNHSSLGGDTESALLHSTILNVLLCGFHGVT